MPSPFASRAGAKLEAALQAFSVSPKGQICADYGCSNGGFTDCLLQHGALRVYAIDTGYGVLDWRLRNDARVVVLERTNAMHVSLPEPVSFAVVDTSWTPLLKVLPNVLKHLTPDGTILALLKPHYEAPRALLRKGVLPPEAREGVIQNTISGVLRQLPLILKGRIPSPLPGAKGGNIEEMLWLTPRSSTLG